MLFTRRAILSFILAATVLVGLSAAPVPNHLMQPTASFFPAATGTVWVYKLSETVDLTWTVRDVREKKGTIYIDVISQRSDEPDHRCLDRFAVSQSGVFEAPHEDRESDDCLLKLPLSIETRTNWEQSTVVDGVKHGWRRSAQGPFEVKVPAGTYQAIRVEAEKYYGDRIWHTSEKWYARGVGIVKMRFPSGDVDLKSYKPAKKQ